MMFKFRSGTIGRGVMMIGSVSYVGMNVNCDLVLWECPVYDSILSSDNLLGVEGLLIEQATF